MFRKMREYLKYQTNRNTVKRELVAMAAAALPVVRGFTEKKADTLQFIQKVVDSGKSLEGEQLVNMLLEQIADKLATDKTRLIQILQYMASLSPEDMRKILVHSMVETMDAERESE